MKNPILAIGLSVLVICLYLYEPFKPIATSSIDNTSLDELYYDKFLEDRPRHLTAQTEATQRITSYNGVHPSIIIKKDKSFVPNCDDGYCKDVVSLAMSKKNLVANTVC